MDKRIYQIALTLLNGTGPSTQKQLLEAVGSLEGVFQEKESNFRHFHGLRIDFSKGLEREKALIRAEQELEFIEKKNVQLYYYEDPNYPFKLKQCTDAPIVLYSLGKVNFNQRNVSIVGTRKCSHYGKKMCRQLVSDLARHKIQVISGLAHGIDKAAHEAALENNLDTIGVLGHGLDTMYPAAHRGLAKRMLDSGGVVTEFISGTVGDPINFPRRNRIVAGLSQATVVVESSQSGGSMITANLANDYNREVFAFPGNIGNESSAGCNNLIQRARAHLLTSSEDLVNVLGWEEQTQEAIQVQELPELDANESQLVHLFQHKGELDADSVAYATKMESSLLSVLLFNLEMKGLIMPLPGRRYKLA